MSAASKKPHWRDDFAGGFDIGQIGAGSKWCHFQLGPYSPIDGIVTKAADGGIRVQTPGAHPKTGEPAFTLSLAQNAANGGVPGDSDHIKWLAVANNIASSGLPGFDILPGKAIHIEAIMGGRCFGAHDHPFGDAVTDPDADFRLGAAGLICADPATNLIFNFFLTNNTIYALYERTPFARAHMGNYASFAYQIPVAARKPDDLHRLRISYDRDTNTAKWFIDDKQVLRVADVGRRLHRKHMFIDKGGDEQITTINQLTASLGMYTFMDGVFDGVGLVDLIGLPENFDPAKGAPVAPTYVNSEGAESHRIFGQGVELFCREFSISYKNVRRPKTAGGDVAAEMARA